jgi:hypothetical protein
MGAVVTYWLWRQNPRPSSNYQISRRQTEWGEFKVCIDKNLKLRREEERLSVRSLHLSKSRVVQARKNVSPSVRSCAYISIISFPDIKPSSELSNSPWNHRTLLGTIESSSNHWTLEAILKLYYPWTHLIKTFKILYRRVMNEQLHTRTSLKDRI